MTFDLPWVLMVSDGVIMRTIHPAALTEAHRKAVEGILLETVVAVVPHEVTPPAALPVPKLTDLPSDKRAVAKAQGYEGQMCDGCGSFNTKRSGTCLTCTNCGATTGCG